MMTQFKANFLYEATKHEAIRWAITGVFFIINCYWISHGQMRTVAATVVLALVASVTALNKNIGISVSLGYLILMGDIRRIISLEFGFPQLDMLLLIGPVMAIWLSIPIFARFRLRDGLSKWITALMAVMVLQIFNPKQGGITVGLAGAMFYLVPILWYWIGRHYGEVNFVEHIVTKLLLPLGVAAAFLGLIQTFVGFLPWEQAWIDTGAMNIQIGSEFRAFGFSVSPAEYGRLLSFASVIIVSQYLARRTTWALLFPVTIIGIILESSRGAFLRVVAAFAVMWGLRAARTKGMVLRSATTLAALLAIVYLAASRLSPDPNANGPKTESLISHQAAGLSRPLDEKSSTAAVHFMYLGQGLLTGLTNPLGYGLGATTGASSKVGSLTTDSLGFATEIDFTDMFEALGIVGGCIYLVVSFLALRYAYEFRAAAPRNLWLAVVGILVANIGNWSISGEYSSSSVIWFLIGVTARPETAKRYFFTPHFLETGFVSSDEKPSSANSFRHLDLESTT